MGRKLSRDDANRINWKRSDREHNEVFPSMFTDLKSLKLKRISTKTGNRNNDKSKDIKRDANYLVGYSGRWTISQPYGNMEKGWEFNVGHYTMGLGMIDFLFEIKNLPEYKDDPLGRVKPSIEDEWEDE